MYKYPERYLESPLIFSSGPVVLQSRTDVGPNSSHVKTNRRLPVRLLSHSQPAPNFRFRHFGRFRRFGRFRLVDLSEKGLLLMAGLAQNNAHDSHASDRFHALAGSRRVSPLVPWATIVLPRTGRIPGRCARATVNQVAVNQANAETSQQAQVPAPRTAASSLRLSRFSESSEVRAEVRGYVPRCNEKACVFPQARPGSGKCLQHERQSSEPDLFGSRQPSMLLLDRAKFGVPDSDLDEEASRANDRRHLSRLWQTFQESV